MSEMIARSGLKARSRSSLRIFAGKLCYRVSRYAQWLLHARQYDCIQQATPLPVECVTHQTPLIRTLANADLWLQQNKVTNLRLAIKKLNGVVIMPGQTFSFWKLVGKPTKRKGYLPGMVLHAGAVKPGTGGGLCQLTNLIYWMALHTPLTVTERYRHSYDVFPDASRTQPFGSGATCAYCSLDLQIANKTDAQYQLELSLANGSLLGCLRSTKPNRFTYEVYEKDHWILPNIWGGYIRHNTLWRRATDSDGNVLEDEFLAENNARMMYQPYLSENSNIAPFME